MDSKSNSIPPSVISSVISTAPGGPMRSGPRTSEGKDTLSSGTGASPFAMRSCTAAEEHYQSWKGRVWLSLLDKEENESILANF